MDDVIIFTSDVKTHKKVLKCFMIMLKKYGTLLDEKLNIWDCYIQAMTIYPVSHHWVHVWKLSLPYQYLWQHRLLNPSLAVLFTLHNFCESFLNLSNPSMIFWKIETRTILQTKFNLYLYTPKAKAMVENIHLIFKVLVAYSYH